MPEIQINLLAIAIAVVANFVLGFIWYTPLFGKRWGIEMGYDPTQKPPSSELMKGMAFMLIGNLMFAYVFAHNMAVWNPLTWGLPASDMSMAQSAGMAAVFTWIGFYLPGDLGSTVWEKKSWTLFAINTGYHLASLILVAFILAYMY